MFPRFYFPLTFDISLPHLTHNRVELGEWEFSHEVEKGRICTPVLTTQALWSERPLGVNSTSDSDKGREPKHLQLARALSTFLEIQEASSSFLDHVTKCPIYLMSSSPALWRHEIIHSRGPRISPSILFLIRSPALGASRARSMASAAAKRTPYSIEVNMREKALLSHSGRLAFSLPNSPNETSFTHLVDDPEDFNKAPFASSRSP